MAQAAASIESNRERANQWWRTNTAKSNDVGPIPKPQDPRRREVCSQSLRRYCETYHENRFPLAWSQDHLDLIAEVEQRILVGGQKAQAMPRGSGKTTLLGTAAEWGLMCGHRSFLFLVAANDQKAAELIEMFKTSLQTNDLLLEDFPEICIPVRALQNEPRRCPRQTCEGENTWIKWEPNKIVFPATPGNTLTSQSVIVAAGITSSSIRGTKHTDHRTGEIRRPDACLIDDPQDEESAASPSQVEKREKIIDSSIMGMSGPTTKMNALMAVTRITDSCLASLYLNRKRKPLWAGTTVQMMPQMPSNLDLWDKYKSMRDIELDATGAEEKSTEWYKENQEDLERGAVCSWPERIQIGDVSAIQTAMKIYLDYPVTFASEYQNDPLGASDAINEILRVDQICVKVGKHPKNKIPADCHTLTVGIDVQGKCLYYVAFASGNNFTGQVVDYGTFPEQQTHYYTLPTLRKTLHRAYPGSTFEGRLTKGLTDLVESLMMPNRWRTESGEEIFPSKILIDANWGQTTDLVKKFTRDCAYRSEVWPCHGIYIGATSHPMIMGNPETGEVRGLNWRMRPYKLGTWKKHIAYDGNFWKTFLHDRLSVENGNDGCINLFNDKPLMHRMFAEHLHAEIPYDVEAKGRRVREWKEHPSHPDNHFFDCCVMALVAASVAGIRYDKRRESQRQIAARDVRRAQGSRKSLADMKKMSQERRGRRI